MARFRKIDPRIWNDERFVGLSERQKLVFFFLLTHPHQTALGGFRTTLEGLSVEIGIPLTSFRRAFVKVEKTGMVEFCRRHHALVLPNFLRYNRPQSPNVVKSWGKAASTGLELIPECDLKTLLVERTIRFVSALGPSFTHAIPKELSDILDRASRNPSGIPCENPFGIPFDIPSPIPSDIPSLNMEKEKEKEKEIGRGVEEGESLGNALPKSQDVTPSTSSGFRRVSSPNSLGKTDEEIERNLRAKLDSARREDRRRTPRRR